MAKAVNIARSHRLDGIGEYYFSRRLREIAEIEAATGRQIIKLAMGSPDLPPHHSVIECLGKEAQRPDVHKYMSYQGEPILRKAFADWYKKWYHVDLDFKSEVYPLIGSKEGIMHICMTFLNPGDKVLVPNPGYPTYSAGVKLAGGVMVPYALNKETNFYPDFEAIEKAGLDGVKMMLVNYPNMPTGQVGSMELFEKIIDFGARHNILIVHDNPYSFIRNSAGPLSIMAVEGAKEVALELNSLSKGHSMAGWRVGVLVGKAEWIKDVMTFRSNMDSGMFYPIQAASATALALGEEWATLELRFTAKFKKDYKLAVKRQMNIDLLDDIIRKLASGEQLPEKNKDHSLTGNWVGHRECHIQPDWLLIYRIENDLLVLT